MNVYDFDGTIYQGDSTIDFYVFCIKKCPIILRCLFRQLRGYAGYKLGIIDKTKFKEEFFCFLRFIPDIDGCVKEFWDMHERNIKEWYLQQRQTDDLVISASPVFLLEEICNRLGIKHLIASNVDPETGIFSGVNCRGTEKVKCFKQVFGSAGIERFYSDSESDYPMAQLAARAFIVNGDNVKEWKV